MLEHLDPATVREECVRYDGMRHNKLFPRALLEKKTQQMLSGLITEGALDQRKVGKLKDALRQIQVEFGHDRAEGNERYPGQ